MQTIETISDARIPAYRDAIDAVARERRFLFLVEGPPLEQSREFVSNLLAGNGVCLVAVDDDAVVGWCDIRRHTSFFAHGGELGMGVLAAYRGRGIGTRLLTTAIAKAWQQDFRRVELAVYADNHAALALYEKAGFVREGLLRGAACVDGVFCDVVWMAALCESANLGRPVPQADA